MAAVIWLGGCACLTAAEGAPDDVDVQMLRHAAEQNDAEAQLRLARMYAQGKGVKQDWEEAYVWAMLARKKRQPDAARLADEAASKLAVKQLLSGIRRVREFKPKPATPFVSIPLPVDAKWAAQVKARRDKARDGGAEEAGDVNAQNALGEYFFEKALKGKDSREHAMALKYFEMAAQKEHESARASLGLLLLKWGKPPGDKARGLRLLQQSAKAEEPMAFLFLASAYGEGMGVAKDEQKAFLWMLKVGQAGNSSTVGNLGKLADRYLQGRGVEKNMREGIKWSLKAAHHGNVGAMLDLGAKYLGGESGAVDVQKGVYWTRLAAGFNNPAAQSNLSLCYGRGVGVTRDVVEALKWATLAARQGDDKGQGLLNQSKAIMESKVGDQVRIRVGEWRSISPPRGLLHMFGVQAK